MTSPCIDIVRHPLRDPGYQQSCKRQLDAEGALVLHGFLTPVTVDVVLAESAHRQVEAFYAHSSHNVYLTAPDPSLPPSHPFNRQVASSKGLLADDQLAPGSPLREVYADADFRRYLCSVLGIESIHAYADRLSSINVHFAAAGQELGWHFDNSSFAVTLLLQAPEAGGAFEYVPEVRDADAGEMGFERVSAVLDGSADVRRLAFAPGDLVLFRGRNALHRVTPTKGGRTRMLVVFAFNDRPGVRLSESALTTFYGRTA